MMWAMMIAGALPWIVRGVGTDARGGGEGELCEICATVAEATYGEALLQMQQHSGRIALEGALADAKAEASFSCFLGARDDPYPCDAHLAHREAQQRPLQEALRPHG